MELTLEPKLESNSSIFLIAAHNFVKINPLLTCGHQQETRPQFSQEIYLSDLTKST